ncbi:MAG: ABC transporter permease [Clostridiaceae bacterium]
MLKYILKRAFISILTIFIVITATFFLIRLMPGGPFDGEKVLPDAIKQNLNIKYGLDKPLFQQYTQYLTKIVLDQDFGDSMQYTGRTVSDVIKYAFPTSAKIGFVSILFALISGIIMGIISALKQGKWQDRLVMVIATLGVTVPSFVMSALFIHYLAVKLGWFQPSGLYEAKSYILPAVALGGTSMAFISRLARSNLIETMKQDYIRVAKAKGLSSRKIILKHALKNSILPIVTYLGPLIAAVLTGSFVVESMFSIPGLGREFVTSVGNRDYTMVLGLTVFYSAFLIICNFIVDVLYGFIDPRIKIQD